MISVARSVIVGFSSALFLCAGLVPLISHGATPVSTIQNTRAHTAQGTIATAGACTNLTSSYFFTISQNPSKTLVLQHGVPSIPINSVPAVGQNVFSIVGSTVSCTRADGTTVQAQKVTYFSVSRSSTTATTGTAGTSPASGAAAGQNPGAGISNSGSPSGIQSAVSNGIQQAVSSGAVSAVTSALSSLISKPYGGAVLFAVECTCSKGDWLVTLGPPNAGTYLVPGQLYAQNPLLVMPTVCHLGRARTIPPGLCWQAGSPCYSVPATQGVVTTKTTSGPGCKIL